MSEDIKSHREQRIAFLDTLIGLGSLESNCVPIVVQLDRRRDDSLLVNWDYKRRIRRCWIRVVDTRAGQFTSIKSLINRIW